MTTLAATKLIQSIALSLSIDEETTSPQLQSAAINYLIGKITLGQLQEKAASFPAPSMLFFRMLELLSNDPPRNFNTDTLIHIHSYLYCDYLPKCEALRKTNLETTGGSHTDFKYLKGSLKNVLARLSAAKGCPQVSKTDFTAHLAHYMQELNILSPFAIGNGITRRTFFALFAISRGFEINYALSAKNDFAYAESQAFAADNPQPLFTCLVKCINYIGRDTTPHTLVRSSQARTINLRHTSAKKLLRRNTKKSIEKTCYPTEILPSCQIITSANTPEELPAQSNQDLTEKIQTIQKKLHALNTELSDILNTINKEK